MRSAEHFRAIVEGCDDAIIGETLDGIVTSWNPGAERIFGFGAAEMIGRSIDRILPAELLAEEDFILLGLEQGLRIDPFETIRIAKDGRRVPVSLAVSPIRDAHGVVIGASKVARDISARRKVEDAAKAATESARQARLEAERAGRTKIEYLAEMSREIGMPLASLDGFADVLTRFGNLARDQRRCADLIRTASAAIRTVVDDILDFSTTDPRPFELELRPFSPRSLVQDALAVAQVVATKKNLRLNCSFERDIPDWLMGDEARLRQILLNLVGNAIEFTSHGSIEVEVSGEPSSDGRRNIRFAVSDSGNGLPAERQDPPFEPFSQADGSVGRQYGGSGLGLAICKRLVDLMHGQIGVRNAVGAGFTFWFTFGLVEAPPSCASPEERNEPGNARILVVDDIDANREIIEAYLIGSGHRIDAVGSAIDAIQMLGTETFDLVLMDIQMPVMDGVAATKRIRALPKPMRDVPVIAMTGNVAPMQIKSFLDAGMNGHIAKPISRAKLQDGLRRWGSRRSSSPFEPPASASPDDVGTVEEFLDAVGVDRARKIAKDFLGQLNAAFRPDCALAEAQRQAHGLVNCAGILGLPRFVDACRAVECQPAGDTASERSALAQIRAERDQARDRLSSQWLASLQD